MTIRPARAVVCSTAAAALLLAASPTPAAALRTLRVASSADAFGSSTIAFAPLVAVAALLAWALVAWLLVVAAATLASRLPGLAGRAASSVARHVAPAVLRRVFDVALGVTMAVGVVGATPAAASPPVPPAPPAATASLDWPTGRPTPTSDANPTTTTATHTAAAPARPAAGAPVVVRPGDSLWAVAADHLPADASEAEVAQLWPTWWAANREAIGADPDLIHPGLRLAPPDQP